MLEPQIFSLFTNLNSLVLSNLLSSKQVRIWGVFFLCLVFSALGVFLSFWLLGTVIKGYRLWGFGLVIAVTMLGISYGAKYANVDAREKFTPVDLILYLTQGFLWPSTWPALAKFMGITNIETPVKGVSLLQDVIQVLLIT